MITIIFIISLLSIYFGICILVGIKWALILFALLLITLSTAFIIRPYFYEKYIKLVNPKYALLYSSKNVEFKRKHKKVDILICYIISGIMLSMSTLYNNTKLPFTNSYIPYLLASAIFMSILLWLASILILKKSKSNSSFWFYFISSIMVIILLLGLLF